MILSANRPGKSMIVSKLKEPLTTTSMKRNVKRKTAKGKRSFAFCLFTSTLLLQIHAFGHLGKLPCGSLLTFFNRFIHRATHRLIGNAVNFDGRDILISCYDDSYPAFPYLELLFLECLLNRRRVLTHRIDIPEHLKRIHHTLPPFFNDSTISSYSHRLCLAHRPW